MFIDYYEVLNVSPNANLEDIKIAYRRESLKWHPDKNHDLDTTSQMQVVNEAYAILKDNEKRDRYNKEYLQFKQDHIDKCSSNNVHSGVYENHNNQNDNSWSYEYDVKDEKLKDDIENARIYAERLVNEFMSSLKQSTKNAAKGALSGMKPYLVWLIIVMLVSVVAPLCSSLNGTLNNQIIPDYSFEETEIINIPNNWKKYCKRGVYQIALPPTMELRTSSDEYTQLLDTYNLPTNNDVVVFQQYGLSRKDQKSFNKYCRVIFQYEHGCIGDFMEKNETTYLDVEWFNAFLQLVNDAVGPYSALLGSIEYCWKHVNGIKYIEINYKRTGANFDTSIPVICKICIFQNSSEMVKIYLAYRENEANIWKDDIELIPKSFMWL